MLGDTFRISLVSSLNVRMGSNAMTIVWAWVLRDTFLHFYYMTVKYNLSRATTSTQHFTTLSNVKTTTIITVLKEKKLCS